MKRNLLSFSLWTLNNIRFYKAPFFDGSNTLPSYMKNIVWRKNLVNIRFISCYEARNATRCLLTKEQRIPHTIINLIDIWPLDYKISRSYEILSHVKLYTVDVWKQFNSSSRNVIYVTSYFYHSFTYLQRKPASYLTTCIYFKMVLLTKIIMYLYLGILVYCIG